MLSRRDCCWLEKGGLIPGRREQWWVWDRLQGSAVIIKVLVGVGLAPVTPCWEENGRVTGRAHSRQQGGGKPWESEC